MLSLSHGYSRNYRTHSRSNCRVIHGVRQLDVNRPQDVDAYAQRFQEYIESRGFSLERTNCHRIAAIYRGQIEDRERGYTTRIASTS